VVGQNSVKELLILTTREVEQSGNMFEQLLLTFKVFTLLDTSRLALKHTQRMQQARGSSPSQAEATRSSCKLLLVESVTISELARGFMEYTGCLAHLTAYNYAYNLFQITL